MTVASRRALPAAVADRAAGAGTPVTYGPIPDPFVTVVVPVYNEADCVWDCLVSLQGQDFAPLEVLVVDDGSVDESVRICEELKITVLRQQHRGPGTARNLGARNAKSNILVFVDADMVVESDYVSKLVAPIVSGQAVATCHWDEQVLNWENPWARCQAYYLRLPERRRQPPDPPAGEEVYRAVRKDFFLAYGGMDEHAGRGDDSSLSRRTGVLADIVRGAVCYHRGPESWREVFQEAVWHGKNVTVEKRDRIRRSVASLLVTNPVVSVWRNTAKAWKTGEGHLPLYALAYSVGFDWGIVRGLLTKNYLK